MSKIKSFLASIKQSAAIAQKQALLKKKELYELKDVYQQIGKYAFDHNLGREQLPDSFIPLDELDVQLQEAGRRESLDNTATLADKAKHTAGRAKDRLTIEALLIKRKSLLAGLGSIIACYEVEDETIVKLQKQAQQIQLEINDLKNSIDRLQSEASFFVRKPYLSGALAVVGIFIVLGMIGGLSDGCGDTADRREIQAMEKENLATQKKIAQEELEAEKNRKLEEAQEVAERKQEEQKRLLEQTRREAETKTREEEKKKVAADKEQKKQEEQQELQRKQEQQEAAAKTRDEEEKKVAEARKQEEQQKHLQEQKDRQAMAEAGFSAINLEPKLYMSKFLESSGAKLELTGKNWNKIKELHGKRDWLSLINLLTDTPQKNNPPASPRRKYHGGSQPPPNENPNEYPPSYLIERAINALTEYDLYVICRTALKHNYENGFCLITVKKDGTVRASDDWELHPDGGRYMVNCSINSLNGVGCVFFGDPHNRLDKTGLKDIGDTISATLSAGQNALEQKRSLGEIDDATCQAKKDELIRRACNQLINVAKAQNRKP